MAEASRRSFFKYVTMFLGGVISVVIGGNATRYFIAPAWKQKRETWIKVAQFHVLPNGIPVSLNYIQRKLDGWMTIQGLDSVWLLRENENLTAFNPKCTHLGCPYRWDESQSVFICPCHTAVFSKTGEVVSGPPPRPLDRFPVKVENGMVMVLPELKGEKA